MRTFLINLCLLLVMTSVALAGVTKHVITKPEKEIKTKMMVYKSGKEIIKERVVVKPAEKKKFKKVVANNPKGQKTIREVQTDDKGNKIITISTYLENTPSRQRIQKSVTKNGKLLESVLVTINKKGQVTEMVEAFNDKAGLLASTRITKWYLRDGKDIVNISYFDKLNMIIRSQRHVKFKDNVGAQVEVISTFSSSGKLTGKTIYRKMVKDGVDLTLTILKNSTDVVVKKTFKSSYIENAEKVTLTLIKDGFGKVLKRIEEREKLKGVIRDIVLKKKGKLIEKIIKIICYGMDGLKLNGPFDVSEVKTDDPNVLTLNFTNKKEKISISKISYEIVPLGKKFSKFTQTLPVLNPSGNFTSTLDIAKLTVGKYTAWFKVDITKKEKPKNVSYLLAVDFEKIQPIPEDTWLFNVACVQVSSGSARMNCSVQSTRELAYTSIQQSANGSTSSDLYYGTSFELVSSFKGDVTFNIKGIDHLGNESKVITFTKNIAGGAPVLNIQHKVLSENLISLDLAGSYDPDQGRLASMEVSYVKFSGERFSIPIAIDELRPYYVGMNVYEVLYLDIKVTDEDGEFSSQKIDLSAALIGFMNVTWNEGNTFEIDVTSYPNPSGKYFFHFYHEATGEQIELETDFPILQYTFSKTGIWSVDWSYKDQNGDRFVVGNARIDVGGNQAPYATFIADASQPNELIIDMSLAEDPDGTIAKYFLAVYTPAGQTWSPLFLLQTLPLIYKISPVGFIK